MSITKSISIRISQDRLALIDSYVDGDPLINRSRLMRRCARVQAKRILKNQPPLYLSSEDEDGEDFTTITVSLSPEDEKVIEIACGRLNHKLGPFIVQSTIAVLTQDD